MTLALALLGLALGVSILAYALDRIIDQIRDLRTRIERLEHQHTMKGIDKHV